MTMADGRQSMIGRHDPVPPYGLGGAVRQEHLSWTYTFAAHEFCRSNLVVFAHSF